jgi:transcriptional regulator with XRE-family HTH domain
MDIKHKFGLRVKELRMLKNMSQESLANSAEIDRTYIQSIEKGNRNVSITVIKKIATALDMSIETLLKNF